MFQGNGPSEIIRILFPIIYGLKTTTKPISGKCGYKGIH
jgi:hypothetical protein